MKKHVNIYLRHGLYYANFRARRKGASGAARTVQINRSTGSADRRIAQRIADEMRNQEALGLWDLAPTRRRTGPTIGQVVDTWLARARIRTARQVAREFLTVVTEGLGLRDAEQARERSASDLTADLMITFRDQEAQRRDPATVNKMMRAARSMFSARAREYYRHLALPDLSGFRGVAFLARPAGAGFSRLDDGVLAAMDAAADGMLELADAAATAEHLRARWRNAWACYWLMRRCGLRNSEVEYLRWEWFRSDGTAIELVPRPYWRPKASPGMVPVAPDLYNRLLAVMGPAVAGEAGFVLAGTPRARWDGTHVYVNVFCRRFLHGRRQAAYLLRKQYGSDMARRYGIETAARLLRHRGIQTAWAHYIDDVHARNAAPL